MTYQPTTLLMKFRLLAMTLAAILALSPLAAQAEVSETTRSAKSISYLSTAQLDMSSKDELLKKSEVSVKSALRKTGFRPESSTTSIDGDVINGAVISAHPASDDIWIYDAYTDLISDFDHDGFYHRFSVTIDADTIFETAYIYARLYLSYEGGPWNHYSSSNNYHINGDSEDDTFIIETELGDGFPAGYYDVRIELYDADHDSWVMTYGPYDDNSLSALPLEDSYYDDDGYYYDDYGYPVEASLVVAGSGSMSWWMLLFPVMLTVLRQSRRRQVSRK